jgi:hypothetical protein
MAAAPRASRFYAVVPAPAATAVIRAGHRPGWPQDYGSRQQARPALAAGRAARARPLMVPDERCARARTGHDHPARTPGRLLRTAEQQATTIAGAQ